MFSKACEYALRAAYYIARSSGRGGRVNVKEVSYAIGSPVAFTSKILRQLVENNIIRSVKGPGGGFELCAEEHTTLHRIVTIFDGDKIFTGCGLGLNECSSENPCPIHHRFAKIRGDLKEMLEQTEIKDFNGKLKTEEILL